MLFLAVLMSFGVAEAQPSDAQIIKDLTSPGVLSVTLSKGGGGKVWSTTDLQYHWERDAVVKRTAGLADVPNVKLEVGEGASATEESPSISAAKGDSVVAQEDTSIFGNEFSGGRPPCLLNCF